VYTICGGICLNLDNDRFGIGELARRTNLTVSTIRAWEQRHGFPDPERLPGGHRRYTVRDVDALNDVVNARQAGTSLATALAQARMAAHAPRSSIVAALRHELDSEPFVLSKLSMFAISRAIEDEALTRSEDALLIGAFQHRHFWHASEHRWRHLANIATVAVVFATMPRRRHRGQLWEIPLQPESPLTREWAVICDSPTFTACLAGVELPDPRRPSRTRGSDRTRRFEALWTVEAHAVRKAARAACALIDTPQLTDIFENHWQQPAPGTAHTLRTSTPFTNRIIRNLDLAKWRS
jgi:DICT domain-containing protein